MQRWRWPAERCCRYEGRERCLLSTASSKYLSEHILAIRSSIFSIHFHCLDLQFSSEWSSQSTCPLQNFSGGWHESWSRQGLLPAKQLSSGPQWVTFTRTWSWSHLHVRLPGAARHKCWQPPLFSEHRLDPAGEAGRVLEDHFSHFLCLIVPFYVPV